jgi:hypothetical protein
MSEKRKITLEEIESFKNDRTVSPDPRMYEQDEPYGDPKPDAPVESILEKETVELLAPMRERAIYGEGSRQKSSDRKRKIMNRLEGGMSCPYRRKGAKSDVQGIKDIQVKGGKFIGCK